MRILLPLSMLSACTSGGLALPSNNPINPQAGCEAAGTEYIRASSGSLSTLQFLINGQATLLDVNSTTTCIRSDGAGAAWLFDVNLSPMGVLRVESDTTGSFAPTDTNLILDLYGLLPTAVRFTGTNYNGTLNVNTLTPYTATLRGTFSTGNQTAIVDFTGTATP